MKREEVEGSESNWCVEVEVGREDESGDESVNEVRVMGMCFSQHSGNQRSFRGKDEWVGTSSLQFIMVGGLTRMHHNRSTTL